MSLKSRSMSVLKSFLYDGSSPSSPLLNSNELNEMDIIIEESKIHKKTLFFN